MKSDKKEKRKKQHFARGRQELMREKQQELLAVFTPATKLLDEGAAIHASLSVAIEDLEPQLFGAMMEASYGPFIVPAHPEHPIWWKFIKNLDNTFDKFDEGIAEHSPEKCMQAFSESSAYFARAMFAVTAAERAGWMSAAHAAARREQIRNSMKTLAETLGMCMHQPQHRTDSSSGEWGLN